MDAGGATDERAILRTAKSCGPDASTLASSCARSNLRAGDGDNKARSPGRARRKPLKPSRAGMPGDPGATVVTNACAYYYYTRGCGCNGHPAFPALLHFGAKDSCTTRSASRREKVATYLRAPDAAQHRHSSAWFAADPVHARRGSPIRSRLCAIYVGEDTLHRIRTRLRPGFCKDGVLAV